MPWSPAAIAKMSDAERARRHLKRIDPKKPWQGSGFREPKGPSHTTEYDPAVWKRIVNLARERNVTVTSMIRLLVDLGIEHIEDDE